MPNVEFYLWPMELTPCTSRKTLRSLESRFLFGMLLNRFIKVSTNNDQRLIDGENLPFRAVVSLQISFMPVVYHLISEMMYEQPGPLGGKLIRRIIYRRTKRERCECRHESSQSSQMEVSSLKANR